MLLLPFNDFIDFRWTKIRMASIYLARFYLEVTPKSDLDTMHTPGRTHRGKKPITPRMNVTVRTIFGSLWGWKYTPPCCFTRKRVRADGMYYMYCTYVCMYVCIHQHNFLFLKYMVLSYRREIDRCVSHACYTSKGYALAQVHTYIHTYIHSYNTYIHTYINTIHHKVLFQLLYCLWIISRCREILIYR